MRCIYIIIGFSSVILYCYICYIVLQIFNRLVLSRIGKRSLMPAWASCSGLCQRSHLLVDTWTQKLSRWLKWRLLKNSRSWRSVLFMRSSDLIVTGKTTYLKTSNRKLLLLKVLFCRRRLCSILSLCILPMSIIFQSKMTNVMYVDILMSF